MTSNYSPLTKYIHYITGKTDVLDDDVKNIYIGTILNISEDDAQSSLFLNHLINENPFLARTIDITTIANFHRNIVKSKYMQFMSDKNKKPDSVIMEIRKKFPELKYDEAKLLLDLQEDSSDFLEEIGISENIKTEKETKTIHLLKDTIQNNLDEKCSQCSNIKEKVLFDSTTDDLSKIKCLFVGEAPAKDEIEQGKPFVGRSGKLLRKTLSDVGFDDIEWSVINTCLCFHQPGNAPTKFEKKMCFDNIEYVLNFLPEDVVIIPLGNHPDERFAIPDKISTASNNVYKYNNRLVFPCFHPAAVCRNMSNMESFKSRLEEIYDIVKNNKIKRVKKERQFTSKDAFSNFENEKIEEKSKLNTEPKETKLDIETKQEESEDDGIMLVDTVYDGDNVHYVIRKDDNKIIKTVDDDYSIYYGNSKFMVENKNKLQHKRINYKNKWNMEKALRSKGMKVYGSDINIKVHKNIEFRKNFIEKEQPLRIGVIDIELFVGEEKILLDNMQKAGEKYTISLITLYDSFEGKYFTFVYNIFDAKISKDEIVKHLDYKDDCKFDIFIYDNEQEMITSFLDTLSELDPDIISGWNCLDKNESIWLDNKITTLDKLSTSDNLYGRDIKKKVNTGIKRNNIIELENGFKISASENHRFPIYYTNTTYKNKNTLASMYKDKQVKEIINDFGKTDQYIKLDIKQNTNLDMTYRKFLINNLDTILSYDNIDILITDEIIFDKLYKNPEVRKKLEYPEYWNKIKFKNRISNRWSYKYLKEYIDKKDLINMLNNIDEIYFLLGPKKTKRFMVNISNIITSDTLYLLGLIFTDGFYYKGHEWHISNNDMNIINHVFEIAPAKYKSKKFKCKDITIRMLSELSLLYSLIYTVDNKKYINKYMFSEFSTSQFNSFFSGCIDGDGSVVNNAIILYHFDNQDNLYSLSELLMWNNGIFNSIQKHNVYIPWKYKHNKKFIESLQLYHTEKIQKLKNYMDKTLIFKNRTSNNLKCFEYDSFYLVRIKNINIENKEVEMVDISTSDHYFITTNGIVSHNCSGFDWPFIYHRCLYLGIPCEINHGPITLDERYGDPVIPFIVEADYLKLYKERSFGKRETYKLDFIAEHELGIKKLHMEERFDDMWKNNPNKFIAYNINDVHLVRLLDDKLKYIDVQYNINKITNVGWRECFGTLSTIDGVIYSYLDKHDKTIISKNHDEEIKHPDLQGAFVRKPLKGLYNWLADLDLTSLYPYIMARFNISPDTFVGQIDELEARNYIYKKEEFMGNKNEEIYFEDKNEKKKKITKEYLDRVVQKNNLIVTIAGTIYLNHESNTSVLYEIIDMLIGERKKYKKMMLDAIANKDDKLAARYNNWQMTYKVLTNSIYGAVGNKYFRLFHFPSAKTITATGREIVKMGAYHVHHYLNKMKDEEKIDVEPFEFNPDFFEESELENIIYGDSVAGDTIIKTDKFPHGILIKELFNKYLDNHDEYNDKEYVFPTDEKVKTIDNNEISYKPINNIMKHDTNKTLYKITTETGKEIVVTEDHSIMVERNNELIKIKPTEIEDTDLVVIS